MKTKILAAVTCAMLLLNAARADGCASKALSRPATLEKKCNLEQTPLTRCDIVNDYEKADNELNIRYRALAKKLGMKSRDLLRMRQREWIKFREQKCDEVQLASGCDNSMCDGVEHDDCVLELTKSRTKELQTFSARPISSPVTDYLFDRRYP